MRRLTDLHYEQLARERGFEWLGERLPDKTTEKTTWRCAEGHRWKTTYHTIKSVGAGCPHCSLRARKNVEDYKALARQFGFVWVGPKVKNTKTKTGWRCSKNHEWMAPYGSISQGSGCPLCAGNAPKTEEDYFALAQERGFVWLGPMVPKVTHKTRWQCTNEHTWESSYLYIATGTGCPTCAGTKRKEDVDYHSLAKKRGIQWLGPSVKNTRTKTQWQCPENHTWFATYDRVRQAGRCPICTGFDNRRKLEADYHDLAGQRGLEWLGPLVKNAKTKTEWQCGKGHTWMATYSSIRGGKGCPTCDSSRPKTPADYEALAKERGLEWLGPMPKNVISKSKWRCAKKHAWLATYTGIRQGGKCPTCVGYDNKRKTEEDYHALAKQRGFEWLGPSVKNTKTKTEWRCGNNHTWFTTYLSIQRGTGCRECYRRRRGRTG